MGGGHGLEGMRDRIVRAGGELGFVPADVARQVVPLPTLSPVATTPSAGLAATGMMLRLVAPPSTYGARNSAT